MIEARSLPQEVTILQETVGVQFSRIPSIKKLTLVNQIAADINRDRANGRSITPLNLLESTYNYLTERDTAGMYVPSNESFLARELTPEKMRMRNVDVNVYGERTLTPEDYKRDVSLHELTHAWMHLERNYDLLSLERNIREAMKHGQAEALEPLIVENAWQEGIADFVATLAEIMLIREGKLEPEHSYGLYRRMLFMRGGWPLPKLRPEQLQALLTVELDEPNEANVSSKLHRRSNLSKFVENFTKYTSKYAGKTLTKLEFVDAKKLLFKNNLLNYAVGYAFVNEVFVDLMKRHFSQVDALSFITSHPPTTILDFQRPDQYVKRQLRELE